MKLTITPGRQSSVTLTVDGKTFRGSFTQDRDARSASKRLGLPAEFIDAAVAKFRTDGTTDFEYTPPVTQERGEQYADTFKVRHITQPAADAVEYDSFEAALGHAGSTGDHLIEWEDKAEAAALDWDWHTGEPPDDITRFATIATPRPTYAWKTRSGGLRLIYLRQGDTPADALAAVAAYSLYCRLSPENLELKTDTRFPPTGAEVKTLAGDFDLSAVRRLFDAKSFDVAARDDYLEREGLSIGRRYPHTQCPFDPERTSNSPDPVLVLEDGIKCYSCQGRGSTSFRSWEQIAGTSVPTEVAVCVKSLTHWDHAKHVIRQHVDLPEGLLESFYRASLIVVYGTDDRRIPSVFRDRDLVRYEGYWGTSKAQVRRDDRLKATIAGLPAVARPDGKVDHERHERFLDSPDLDLWGYFPLKRVFGTRISTRFMDAPDRRPRIEVPSADNPATYLEPAGRLTEDAAWGILESAYPGVRRGLIELLVFCRGLTEYGAANAPMFILEGASGSGKTGSPHLAAAICGDHCVEITPQEKDDRLYTQILGRLRSGAFISISEVVKAARKFRIQPRDYLNFLLQITPKTVAWQLYKGPVEFGEVPVLTISDTEFTDEILSDTQLGRRLFYCDLGTEYNDWRGMTAAQGLSDIFAVRSLDSFRLAADSLVSIWTDRYWTGGHPFDIQEVARNLGVSLLSQRQAANDRADLMRALFTEWMKYAGASGSYRDRQAKGFKAFKIDPDKYAIARVWVQLHDDGSPTTWSRANERSWQSVTGHPVPVKLLIRKLYDDRESWVQLSFQEQKGDVWTALT